MSLEVRIYDNNLTTPTLIEEVTDRLSNLQFSTALNGGFKTCGFKISMSVEEAWNWLSREGKRGYHFYRVTVHDERTLVWEGRIMDIQLQIDASNHALSITSIGYWSACHDQFYTTTGNTDWTSGSGHFMHEIIAEMLTEECPDISSDQTNLEEPDVDLVGIDLSAKEYPQRRINDLVKLSSSDHSVWFFAIWDDRVPYLFKRNVTQIDWYVWLDAFTNLRLDQSALALRNSVIPVQGTTLGTAVDNAGSLLLYPRREVKFQLPTSAPSAPLEDAASMFVSEQGLPRQQQGFEISGKVFRVNAAVGGRLEEVPKYMIRAGEVIRIQDLVPASVSVALDDVRTFYIMETNYNADTDVVTIQPDRRARTLPGMLAEKIDATSR
jgi:hypothetical protein